MRNRGKKIVLAASTSESSEYLNSTWRQMLLGTLPSRYSRFPFYMIDVNWQNETHEDGQAVAVPNGLRVVESILLEKFSPDDIAVCYPDQLDLFVGEDTRVVGVHAHNPLGITFATDVYVNFYGKQTEPINAAEFKRLITHEAIKKHKDHLKVIVGGPGSWQIEKKNLQDEWKIDCIVEGEAEDLILDLFERAVRGESLPKRMEGNSPKMENIPTIKNRSTFGVVEVTRGCGRGCQFCSIALRKGRSLPLEHILGKCARAGRTRRGNDYDYDRGRFSLRTRSEIRHECSRTEETFQINHGSSGRKKHNALARHDVADRPQSRTAGRTLALRG